MMNILVIRGDYMSKKNMIILGTSIVTSMIAGYVVKSVKDMMDTKCIIEELT